MQTWWWKHGRVVSKRDCKLQFGDTNGPYHRWPGLANKHSAVKERKDLWLHDANTWWGGYDMLLFFAGWGNKKQKKSISTYDASNENCSANLLYYLVLFYVVAIVLFIICIQVIHKEEVENKCKETCIFDVRVSHFSIVGQLENRLPEWHSVPWELATSVWKET